MSNLSICILTGLVPLTKTDDFFEDISDDVGKSFDTLNYDERRRKRTSPAGEKQNLLKVFRSETFY